MANQLGTDEDNTALPNMRAEMLLAVLSDDEAYPWLADEAADSFGDRAEAAGQTLEISDEEAEAGWQGLSATLTAAWSDAGVVASLMQKFAGKLPGDMISLIGEKAQQLVGSGEAASQSVLEQMMACVQDVLSHVADDDLRVMGRPMAMAMRGNSADEFVEATIQSVRSAEWAALSPIEQARLGLAAARYAIAQAEGQG